MNCKRSRAWLAGWVLPAFLLRSLIPLGFMPMFGPGLSVQLALCETYAPMPSHTMDPAMDMSDDMSMDRGMGIAQASQGEHPTPTNDGHAAHQDHGICLFGAGPVLGTPLAFSLASPVQQHAMDLAALAPQVNHFDVPYRAQSARGPPV